MCHLLKVHMTCVYLFYVINLICLICFMVFASPCVWPEGLWTNISVYSSSLYLFIYTFIYIGVWMLSEFDMCKYVVVLRKFARTYLSDAPRKCALFWAVVERRLLISFPAAQQTASHYLLARALAWRRPWRSKRRGYRAHTSSLKYFDIHSKYISVLLIFFVNLLFFYYYFL